ncbi:hypothetical protein AXI59_16255 [Bacillus nakamurai]|uniref:S-Ena type endospore appendage n=1 Tax=Bacillus nakamurai TaxID=1793963 RepID=UPI00077842A5|nr:S-Ena type endospore appendage [Bacillus nakamurai]KXZ18810.1 hypothetical protein AXI59_16255 [Bacillus nakamurai]
MCGSKGNDCCCCPNAMIFQEELCGNFGAIDAAVWTAPTVNDYIQGTFEVFNAGPGTVDFSVTSNGVLNLFHVPPENSIAVSFNNPTRFAVQTIFGEVYNGSTGKWCITLYKRIFE